MGSSRKASRASVNGQLSRPEEAVHTGTTPTYFNAPHRQKGELPPNSVASDIRDVARQIARAPISRRERTAARLIDRRSVPLSEFDDATEVFDTWGDVVDACHKVLGGRRSRDLAAELGYSATGVLSLATALG